jgi:hypothetical protein
MKKESDIGAVKTTLFVGVMKSQLEKEMSLL